MKKLYITITLLDLTGKTISYQTVSYFDLLELNFNT
jgi:hypothetical protein